MTDHDGLKRCDDGTVVVFSATCSSQNLFIPKCRKLRNGRENIRQNQTRHRGFPVAVHFTICLLVKSNFGVKSYRIPSPCEGENSPFCAPASYSASKLRRLVISRGELKNDHF
jgi:hypothetical protein